MQHWQNLCGYVTTIPSDNNGKLSCFLRVTIFFFSFVNRTDSILYKNVCRNDWRCKKSAAHFANWRRTVKENPHWNMKVQAIFQFGSSTSLLINEVVFHVYISMKEKKLCIVHSIFRRNLIVQLNQKSDLLM